MAPFKRSASLPSTSVRANACRLFELEDRGFPLEDAHLQGSSGQRRHEEELLHRCDAAE